jgi:type I restriction enzyme S subunit
MKRWPTKPLGELVDERSERLGKEAVTIYSVTNEDGFVRSLDLFDKRVFSADTSNYKRVGFYDLAYNPSRINVGSVAICEDRNGGAVSPMYIIIRCKPGLLPRYLLFFLKSEAGLHQIRHRCEGAVRFQLKFRDLCAIPIIFPTLEEQKRIVELLDEADELRKLRVQADRRTADLVPALFYEMFGDPLQGVAGWPMVRLGNLCKIRRGASPRPINKFLGGTVPWIKIGDGTQGDDLYIEHTNKCITEQGMSKSVFLEPGSLIFANCGVSLGFARILRIGGCIHDGWLALEELSPRLDKIFLLKLINMISDRFRRIAPQGTQPNLNTSIMNNFSIPLPPVPLQQDFAQRVSKIRELESRQVASRRRLEELFQSLLYRAFNGEL